MRKTPPKSVIESIMSKYPTPFYLYDAEGIRAAARSVNSAFSWNNGFKEHYAVKANPNPSVLRLLKDEGCGVDCASLTELMLADRCGFHGEDIMFSSNVTPSEEYILARKLGATINLDDISHIEFLKVNGGIPERICLRYNPGGEFRIGNQIMGNPGDSKFGMTREQIFAAVSRLKELGTAKFALHSFLSSNTLDESYYPRMAEMLFKLASDIMKSIPGTEIYMINLSGGIGIPYRPEEKLPDIQKIGSSVKNVYDKHFTSKCINGVRISAELGRYVTGPSGYLVTTAIHKKSTYKEYIGLDASSVDLIRPAMYGAYHHATVIGKEDMPCDMMYDLTGSLCENNDKLAVDRLLPIIYIGDTIVFHDVGAHVYAMSYNYNGKLRSAEFMYESDGSCRMIRRAETPEDYFATLDFNE